MASGHSNHPHSNRVHVLRKSFYPDPRCGVWRVHVLCRGLLLWLEKPRATRGLPNDAELPKHGFGRTVFLYVRGHGTICSVWLTKRATFYQMRFRVNYKLPTHSAPLPGLRKFSERYRYISIVEARVLTLLERTAVPLWGQKHSRSKFFFLSLRGLRA